MSEGVVDDQCILACKRACPVASGSVQMLQKTHSPHNSPRQQRNAVPLTKPLHKRPAGNMIMPRGKKD